MLLSNKLLLEWERNKYDFDKEIFAKEMFL